MEEYFYVKSKKDIAELIGDRFSKFDTTTTYNYIENLRDKVDRLERELSLYKKQENKSYDSSILNSMTISIENFQDDLYYIYEEYSKKFSKDIIIEGISDFKERLLNEKL